MKELPPVRPQPDTRGWPVVTEPPKEIWLGSFDDAGNRIDVDTGNTVTESVDSMLGEFTFDATEPPPEPDRP